MFSLAHLPYPEDPPAIDNGSAVMTVIRGLMTAAGDADGSQAILTGLGTRHDLPLTVVPCLRGGRVVSLPARTADVVTGRVLGRRLVTAHVYEPLAPVPPIERLIVHNRPGAVLAPVPAARRFLYCHNDVFGTYGRRETERILRRCEAVIAVSEYLADRMPRSTSGTRVFPLLNGVDTDEFTPGRQVDRPSIVYVGRVIREKGVHVLIRAAALLGHLDFQVVIMGGSKPGRELTRYERQLRRLVTCHGMEDRVLFHGRVERSRVPEMLRRHHVIVVPSVWPEPCSLTLAEGAASGLACLASRAGGLPEVASGSALLHEPGNERELAEHLEHLISDDRERRHYADMALTRARELSWRHQLQQFRRVVTDS
ncbi:glycosyltransferase family 4 protein [Geodermatophilus sabuli]|uniref:Glycosyltransferase involved in cell wall bisynthesis n=1 Tax=Geodermatophilus sabuli TaxID=1564158 RepID=A0A285EIA2_9ACTN|nr:glycosyltransferase family 4 protein [Geodermatophilus sabuli]MBB3086900.1 glycosyltransferase involved in cell wall biosynthesis [Geodermatophilus sabuli]SNX98727.1 Glycosyltransferase involved in cell wall bisynthesis [Geodermatophilus sabuli]